MMKMVVAEESVAIVSLSVIDGTVPADSSACKNLLDHKAEEDYRRSQGN